MLRAFFHPFAHVSRMEFVSKILLLISSKKNLLLKFLNINITYYRTKKLENIFINIFKDFLSNLVRDGSNNFLKINFNRFIYNDVFSVV